MNELAYMLIDVANKNESLVREEDITMNFLQHKLEELVDNVLNYKIDSSDPTYRNFNDIIKKQFATNIYLTRIVSIISKIVNNISNLNVSDDLQGDLKVIKAQFKTRPNDFIAIHFDLITDVIWKDQEHYTLIEAMDKMCDTQSNETYKRILMENMRVKNLICSKRYKEIYSEAMKDYGDDLKNARYSLINLMQILQNGTDDEATDVFDFFNERYVRKIFGTNTIDETGSPCKWTKGGPYVVSL